MVGKPDSEPIRELRKVFARFRGDAENVEVIMLPQLLQLDQVMIRLTQPPLPLLVKRMLGEEGLEFAEPQRNIRTGGHQRARKPAQHRRAPMRLQSGPTTNLLTNFLVANLLHYNKTVHARSTFWTSCIEISVIETEDEDSEALKTTPTVKNENEPVVFMLAAGAVALLQSFERRGTENDSHPNPEFESETDIIPPLPDIFNLDESQPLETSGRDRAVADIASAILAGLGTRFDEVSDVGSDDEENREEADSDIEQPEYYDFTQESSDVNFDGPRKRQRNTASTPMDPAWFPWKDRITCSLDILMHLPRSVFSEKQLDLFLWLLNINKLPAEIPSVDSMKALNEKLQKLYGVNSIRKQGALGHVYY
ncbi:hypothetical protein K435DRAFT_813558, partial [Dendrothele bispora CBS 962.96]